MVRLANSAEPNPVSTINSNGGGGSSDKRPAQGQPQLSTTPARSPQPRSPVTAAHRGGAVKGNAKVGRSTEAGEEDRPAKRARVEVTVPGERVEGRASATGGDQRGSRPPAPNYVGVYKASAPHKPWSGILGNAFLASFIGNSIMADGKEYLDRGIHYDKQQTEADAAQLLSEGRIVRMHFPKHIGSPAADAALQGKRDFRLPFNIAKDRDALLKKSRNWPSFLKTLPLSAGTPMATPAQAGRPLPSPAPPTVLKELVNNPAFLDRFLEADPTTGPDGKHYERHGLYWHDDGRGSAEVRKANAWKRKLGLDGVTYERLLPMPMGRAVNWLEEKRDYCLPFDIMKVIPRATDGRHQHVIRPSSPPAPIVQLQAAPIPANKAAPKTARSTPLSRQGSKQSRASATDLAGINAGERRYLDHGIYWTEDPRVRPAQRQANVYKPRERGVGLEEGEELRLMPTPRGEGQLRLQEERDFDLPLEMLREFGKVVDKSPSPAPVVAVAMEAAEVVAEVPVVKEVVRKPPPYKVINKNIFVGRGKDAEDHPAVCECKRPTDPAEEGCGEDCLNRAMAISCSPKTCPCGEQCANKPYGQLNGVDKKALDIFWTGNRGWGLRTLVDIKKDDFIIEYCGEVISRAESYRRVLNEYKDWHAYYFLNYDGYEVIDAGLKGNCARFINHSCGPNVRVASAKYADVDEFQIGIFATEDIKAGTELGYDYGWQNFADLRAQVDSAKRTISDASSTSSTHEASTATPAAAQALSELGRQRCFCGAAACSGWLGKKADKAKGAQAPVAVAAVAPKKKARPAKRAALALVRPPTATEEAGRVTIAQLALDIEKAKRGVAEARADLEAYQKSIKDGTWRPTVAKKPKAAPKPKVAVPKKITSLATFVDEAKAFTSTEFVNFNMYDFLRPKAAQWVVGSADMRPPYVDALVYADRRRAEQRWAERERTARELQELQELQEETKPTVTLLEKVGAEPVKGAEPAPAVVKKVARVHPRKKAKV